MTQHHYRPNVRYASVVATGTSLREANRLPADAIRGIMIGVPIAVLMWMPIVWGLSRLI